MGRADEALLKLRKFLRDGKMPLGSRLPPERELAVELAVSRGALRRALGRLEAEGKVWRHVGKGTFVGSRPAAGSEEFAIITRMTSPSEVMELRLLIEPPIARLAALRATATDIAHMSRCLDKLEHAVQRGRSSDGKLCDEWDGTLHRAIAEATHNVLVLALFDSVNAVRKLTAWGRLQSAALTRERWQLYCSQHRRIVEAIAERDLGEAEASMRRHLETVQRNLTARLRAVEEPQSSPTVAIT